MAEKNPETHTTPQSPNFPFGPGKALIPPHEHAARSAPATGRLSSKDAQAEPKVGSKAGIWWQDSGAPPTGAARRPAPSNRWPVP